MGMLATFFQQVYRQVLKTGTLASETLPAAYIEVGQFERFAFALDVGATDQGIAFKVVQATDSAGTGSKDITSAAITALTATDDNKQVLIEVQTAKLDINNGFNYVACTTTLTGGSATVGHSVFYGINPKVAPVTQPAAFVQQVLVAG